MTDCPPSLLTPEKRLLLTSLASSRRTLLSCSGLLWGSELELEASNTLSHRLQLVEDLTKASQALERLVSLLVVVSPEVT